MGEADLVPARDFHEANARRWSRDVSPVPETVAEWILDSPRRLRQSISGTGRQGQARRIFVTRNVTERFGYQTALTLGAVEDGSMTGLANGAYAQMPQEIGAA